MLLITAAQLTEGANLLANGGVGLYARRSIALHGKRVSLQDPLQTRCSENTWALEVIGMPEIDAGVNEDRLGPVSE
jgi:hypothetical protein